MAMKEATPRLPAQSGAAARLPIGNYRKELGIFALLFVLCVATSVKSPAFFSGDNMQNLARLIGIYGIFSIGMGVVIITSGIDLTVGSMFALEGVLFAMALAGHHWPPLLAVIAMLAFTMALGAIHGLLITRVPLQPFIVTLCGLLIYRGLARFISGDATEGFGDAQGFQMLQILATKSLSFGHVNGNGPMMFILGESGVPMAFIIMLVISVIMWIVLHRSVYGRYLYAIGRNEEAARYSGINSKMVITSAYVLSGLLGGISGILLAFYTNSISPSTHGNSYELYGIAAAVVGGCSLRGGEGSVVGILIGTALIQVLQNLVNLCKIPSSLNFAVVGAVILLGVITDELVKRRSSRVKA